MANIDSRIVEMKFENHLFEKNVNNTISALDKLKEALNFKGAEKSFEDVEEAANKLDFSTIEKSLNQLNDRFSVFGVAGMSVISSLTQEALKLGSTLVNKVMGPITTGGWNRATNIDKAKFQLEGLNVAWKEIEEDINYGVADTAYGLDAAATAASQLVASGVKFGETFGETGNSPMAKALRGISGVAAMTNSSYEEIAHIFTTVAGQGKVMTMQLRQLELRGLNAAAKLGEAMGKTEAEVREMVTKGELDFAKFSEAMDKAFGEHAKEANKTFEGALANMKSALGRIGAEFAAPYRQAMIPIFNKLREIFNDIKKVRMVPIFEDFKDFADKASNFVTFILDKVDLSFFDGIATTLHGIYVEFDSFMGKWFPFWKNTEDELETTEETALNTVSAIEEAAKKVLSGDYGTGEDRRKALEELGYVYELVQNKVNELLGVEYRYEVDAEAIAEATDKQTNAISKNAKARVAAYKEAKKQHEHDVKWAGVNKNLEDSIGGITSAFRILSKIVGAVGSGSFKPLTDIGFSLITIFTDITGAIGRAISSLDEFLEKSGFYETISSFVNDTLSTVADIFDSISSYVDTITGGEGPIKHILDSFTEATESQGVATFNNVLTQLIGSLTDLGVTMSGNVIEGAFSIIGTFLNELLKQIPKAMVAIPILGGLFGIVKLFLDLGKVISGAIGWFTAIPNAINAFANQINATALLTTSAAVFVMAGALTLLAQLNWGQLAVGATGIIGIAAALGGLMFVLNLLNRSIDGDKGIFNIVDNITRSLANKENSTTILKLAAAIAILAASMTLLAQLSWEGLLKGIIAIGVLTGAILLIMKSLANMPAKKAKSPIEAFTSAIQNVGSAVTNFLGKVGTAALLVSLGITVMAIAGAVTALSKISWEDGLRGCTFLGIILAELAISLAFIKKFASGAGSVGYAIFLLALGQIVSSMGKTLKQLSEVSWDQGLRGVILMGLVLMELTLTLKAITALSKAENAVSLALLMGAIALVVSSMGKTIKNLSEVDFLAGIKALGFMGILLLELTLTMKSLSTLSKSEGGIGSIVMMGVLALVARSLAGTIKELSEIPFADGLKALGLLAGLFLELSLVLKSIAKTPAAGASNLITLIGFSVAIKIMSGAIVTLSEISGAGIAKALIAVGGISVIMSLMLKTLGSISDTKTILKSILAIIPIVLALFAVVGAISALSDIEPSRLLAAGAALTMIMSSMVAFSAGMKMLAKTKFTTILGAVLGFTAVIAAMAGILYLMRNLDADQMIAMSTALSQMMAALGIMAAGTSMLSGNGGFIQSLSSALSGGVLLAIFTAIIAGIIYLNTKIPGMQTAVEKSIPLFQKVGEALGSLFGGFLSKALLEPLSKSFDGMGKGLQSFIDNIMPFINGTKDVPSDTSNIDNLKTLITKMGELGTATIGAGFASWFADETGQEGTFSSLNKFLNNFEPFANRINDLKPKKAIGKLEKIQDILDTLTGINFSKFKTWVTQNLLGDKDITPSFERATTLAGKIADFASTLEPLDDKDTVVSKVETVQGVVQKLGEVNLSSWFSSITQSFTGQESMMTAMGYLIEFGNQLRTFATVMGDITGTSLATAERGFAVVEKFVGLIPGTSGWAQAFTGEKDLADFGDDLVWFGGDMEDFFRNVSGVDTSGADRIAWSLLRLEHVFETIMTEGGLSDPNFLQDRLHNLSETIGNIFEEISVDIGDEGAKVPLLEAGENMFNYLLEGFETAGEGYTEDSRVGGSINKIADEITKALLGKENEEAMSKEAMVFIEQIVSDMQLSATDSQETLTTSLTNMLETAIDGGIAKANVKFTDMDTAVRKKLTYIVDSIVSYKDSFTNAIGTACSGMEGKLREYIKSFTDLGKDMAEGLIKGLESKTTDITKASGTASENALDAAKQAVDSNSPAKKFIELGEDMMLGLAIGERRNSYLAINAAAKTAGSLVTKTGDRISDIETMSDETMGEVLTTIMGAWAYITSMIDQDMTWQPVITPVLDLSNVQNGLGGMDSILSSGYHFGATGIPDIYANRMNVGATGDLYDQEAILSQIRALRTDIATLGDAISKMQITMSTGQVVGAVTPGIDRELGSIQKYNARWA